MIRVDKIWLAVEPQGPQKRAGSRCVYRMFTFFVIMALKELEASKESIKTF